MLEKMGPPDITGFGFQIKPASSLRSPPHQARKPNLSGPPEATTILTQGAADTATINAQATLVATAEANLAVLRAQEYTQFVALLTPSQVTTLSSIQAAREARFQKFLARMATDSQ